MTRDLHAHIGHVAGIIWRRLDRERRAMSLLELSVGTRTWPWEVLLAAGWLSREGKVRCWRRHAALMIEQRGD